MQTFWWWRWMRRRRRKHESLSTSSKLVLAIIFYASGFNFLPLSFVPSSPMFFSCAVLCVLFAYVPIICLLYWLATKLTFASINIAAPKHVYSLSFFPSSFTKQRQRHASLGSLLATAYWITLINSSKWPLKLHQNKHRRNKNARQTDITFN